MSKSGVSTSGWRRPSSKSTTRTTAGLAPSNSKPLRSSDVATEDTNPTRRTRTHQRSESKAASTPAPKTAGRERKITPEERLAKERERDRERKNNAAVKSRESGPVESKGGQRSTTRLKSETKLSKHNKSRKGSTLPGTETPPVSEEEYSSLPLQIQRKYFSDLERLHIAYSSVHQAQKSSSSISTNSVPHPPSTSRSSAHRHYHPQASTQTPSTPHLNSLSTTGRRHLQPRRSQHIGVDYSQDSFGDVLTAQAEAQWYNTLPDKARHQLFSIEEQDVLAETLQPVNTSSGLHSVSASRKVYRNAKHNRKAAPVPYISSSDGSDPHKSNYRRRRHDYTEMATTRKRSDTELPTYNRHSIIHRSNSPHGLPWDSQAPPLPAPRAPLLTTHRRSKSFATLASANRPSCDATASATDPEAVYYRDPDARHKLRQYLASPQRFDEALNFGFPSEYAPETPQTYTYRTPSANTHYDTCSSTMETPELDDYRSYGTSDTGTESPHTPADADFSWRASKFNRVSIFGSLNTESIPSFDLKFIADKPKPEPIVLMAPPLMNREMTLRMTLTRPDLRANEEEMYGYSRPTSDDDPLALDQLPNPLEDVSGTRGAFTPARLERDSQNQSHYFEASQPTRRSSKTKEISGISRFFRKLRRH